jgi:RimJ/RimL family protein N-acetyltransferase
MTQTATLRPIEPSDADRLRRFHERLSEDTVQRRYHGPHPHLSDREVAYLVGATGPRHIAWVACDDDGELLGECRIVALPDDPREGEIAIVVADRLQHHGIGHDLLRRVFAEASHAGFRRAQALILGTNRHARDLFVSVADEMGIPWFSAVSGGVIDLRFDLGAR